MFERTDIDDVTVDELFVDIESKILGRGLRGSRIGRRRGGNAGGRNPLKRVLRPAVYRVVDDADADGLIQDGTIHERPAKPKLEVPGSVLSGNPLDDNSPARELVSLVKKPKKPAKRKKGSAKPDFDEILRVEEEDNAKAQEEAKAAALEIQARLDQLNAKFRFGNEDWETRQDIELARESLETIAAALAEDEEIWDRSRLAVSPREAAMGRLQVMRDRLLLQQSHFDELPDREFEELLYNLLKVDEPDWAVDYFKGLALQSAFERYGSRGVDEIVFSDDLDPDIPWQDVVSNPPISDSGRLDLKDISDYIDSQYKDSDDLLLEQAIHGDPSNFYEFLRAYEERESKDILAPNADLETDEDLDTFWEDRHREMFGHENAVAALSSPEGIALAESLQSVFESEFGPDSPIAQLFEKYDNPIPLVVLASHAGSHWAGGVAGQYYEGVVTFGVVDDFEPKTGAYILRSEPNATERVTGEFLIKGGPDDHVATVVHEMGHAFHEVINNNVTPMVSVTDLSREWDRLVADYYSEMQALQDIWDNYQDESWEELSQLEDDWQSVMLGDPESTWLNVKDMRLALDRAKKSGYFDESEEAEAERIIDAVTQLNIPKNQQISQYSITNKLESFAETFTAVMLDADTEGLSDSGQALVDFMRRVVDRPRVSEVSSFDGDKVSEPGVGSLVSERISERLSPRDGFSSLRPARQILDTYNDPSSRFVDTDLPEGVFGEDTIRASFSDLEPWEILSEWDRRVGGDIFADGSPEERALIRNVAYKGAYLVKPELWFGSAEESANATQRDIYLSLQALFEANPSIVDDNEDFRDTEDNFGAWQYAMRARQLISVTLKAPESERDPDVMRFLQLVRRRYVDEVAGDEYAAIRLYRSGDLISETGTEPNQSGLGYGSSNESGYEAEDAGITSWSVVEKDSDEWGSRWARRDVPNELVLGRFGTVQGEILVADNPEIIAEIENWVPPAVSVIEPPEPVSKEVSDLVKAIQELEGKVDKMDAYPADYNPMHKLLVNYDDATVAAAARIIFDRDIDASGVSMLVGKSKIFDIPDADNNPTAVLPDTIFDEILKVDPLYSVPKDVFEDQEADFHNGSAGIHEIFQVLNTLDPGIDEDEFDPSDMSTWGSKVDGPMSDSQHRETLSTVLDFVVPNFEGSSSAEMERIIIQAKVEEIVRKWEQDNPIPEFVRNFDARAAENPDWESQIPDRSTPDDGPLAGDKEALELSDALYALYDEQQSLLKARREADRDFDMQKMQEISAQIDSVNNGSDELSKKLGDLLKNVRKRRDQLEADHAAERQIARDEAESYVSSLPQDFSREDIKEAFISSILYAPDRPKNDDGSYKPIVLSEVGSALSKQISALSSAETLLAMIESDPSVRDALYRIFDNESPYEFVRSVNRFQEGFLLVDPLEDPFSNPFIDSSVGVSKDVEHYDFLNAFMVEIKTRGIVSDSISDRAKAVFIFDELNSKWAVGSDTGKAWMMSVAVAKLVGSRGAGKDFSAFRTPPRGASRFLPGGKVEDLEQVANDYQILAKAIYSTTQNHLENMGITEDGIVRLSRAMTVGPDRIADTPRAEKLQMEIEKKRTATVDELNLTEQNKELLGDELEKIYANPLWAETVRAARAGEFLSPAQTLLLERYRSAQTAHDSARNEVGDLMVILRSLDSTDGDISWALDASVGKGWAVDAIAQWNGLSSFATITQQAFGEHTFHMDVPRSRLFSLSMLGFGCISEYEVLVIGDGDDNVLYERQRS